MEKNQSFLWRFFDAMFHGFRSLFVMRDYKDILGPEKGSVVDEESLPPDHMDEPKTS